MSALGLLGMLLSVGLPLVMDAPVHTTPQSGPPQVTLPPLNDAPHPPL
jgi:hypothetical protein